MIIKIEIMIKNVNIDEEESLQITSYVTQSDDDDNDCDDFIHTSTYLVCL